jgi:hypothetical protein
LFCPGPSSLSRPHPPHSRAHRDFTARRFIRDAFAVRERRGDPRVVPSFRCIFLPGMPSSASPGSSTSHCPIARCRHGLRHGLTGSTLPTLPQSDSRGRSISGLTGSPLLRPVSLLASPCRIRPGLLPAHRRLLRPGFRTGRSPFPPLDMTTTSIGLLCRRDLHPLEQQLASLHQPGARVNLLSIKGAASSHFCAASHDAAHSALFHQTRVLGRTTSKRSRESASKLPLRVSPH